MAQDPITISNAQDRFSAWVERRSSFLVALANLETRVYAQALADKPVDQPIYICGLARSGSTILLEYLARHPDLATHRYRDYPLLITPIWWNAFLDRASRPSPVPVERAHKDRIKVTPESPEAMEEVLWMHFFPECHNPSKRNVMGADDAHPAFEAFYRDHIRKILLIRRGQRYLSKGNYNVARMAYIRKLFPSARFVVPVRDPVSHIASLMKQDRLFRDMESADPKALNYMRRSGHFEFGLDRRPINTGDDETASRVESLWQTDPVRGWAVYWAYLYGYVADLLAEDVDLRRASVVVHYDDLCARSRETLERIYALCELSVADGVLNEQAAQLSLPDYYVPPFSDDDIRMIGEITGETDARMRRLARPAIADAAP